MHVRNAQRCLLQVCDDTIEEDDGKGNQTLFRVIRVPFRVVFVSGNLKLRFHVKQSRKEGKVLHALWHAVDMLTMSPASVQALHRSVGCGHFTPLVLREIHCMQINFVNVKEGRLITNLLAQFDVTPVKGKLPLHIHVMSFDL